MFNYPELREFAISSLEKSDLMPIDRIQLSDELSLPQWEKPAFTELCQRTEPISISEAQVLGVERLTHIARVREIEQRRQFLNNIIEPLKAQCLPKDMELKLDSGMLFYLPVRSDDNNGKRVFPPFNFYCHRTPGHGCFALNT